MKNIVIITCIIFGSIQSFGQNQLIEVSEIIGVADKIRCKTSGIVDINSHLQLKIIHKNIAIKVGNTTNANPKLISELQQYDKLLVYQKDIQVVLSMDLSNSLLSERIEILGKFSDKMDDFYEIVFGDRELEGKFVAYYDEFEVLPETEKVKYGDYYIGYGIAQLSIEISKNLNRLQKIIDNKKIKIQITAYLNTKEESNKKVHIENFDDYKLGEFFEVERWATSFSEEDITAFNNTQELSNKLNSLVDENFKNMNDFLHNNINSVECINNLLKEIKNILIKKETIFTTNFDIATTTLKQIKYEFTDFYSIASKINDYDGVTENALELFNTAQNEFTVKAKALPRKIEVIIDNLPIALRDTNPDIISLISSFESCKSIILADLGKLKSIAAITTKFLTPSQITAINGMEIGKEVYSYSIEDLPDAGYINLRKTGKRSNGDKLEINISIKTPDEPEKKKKGTTVILGKQILTLQQINLYSVSNVSVILANPFNYSDKVTLENKFQFAPSGSLLFKFGSRTNKTWNYLEPGIGFNISTPDFDLDGTPEIGLGGVFTLLKDVISIGISYNTKTDNPYWFFGLSLPFSVPGIPINNIETNAKK
ncbi:MAG: hypothetical protein COC16_03430 [Lutibacter sp.]|nr:MAG: hypothetical protein COC16_03430 [Lutibacter sp.]